jgi:predicted DNA binding CopG/RHH family protein
MVLVIIYNFIKTKIFRINNKDKTTNYKIEDRYPDKKKLNNYDFTEGVRGRFYKPKKVPASMRLDNYILIFLKKASEKKITYQTLINNLLREHIQVQGLRSQKN